MPIISLIVVLLYFCNHCPASSMPHLYLVAVTRKFPWWGINTFLSCLILCDIAVSEWLVHCHEITCLFLLGFSLLVLFLDVFIGWKLIYVLKNTLLFIDYSAEREAFIIHLLSHHLILTRNNMARLKTILLSLSFLSNTPQHLHVVSQIAILLAWSFLAQIRHQ